MGPNGGSIWSGGTISGTGLMTVNSNLQVDGLMAAMTLDTRSLVNNGTLSYSATTNGLILAKTRWAGR
jgi:hypothetical protein